MKWIKAIILCVLSLFLVGVFYFYNDDLVVLYIVMVSILLILLSLVKATYPYSQNMSPSLAKIIMQFVTILSSNVFAACIMLILILTLEPAPRKSSDMSTGLDAYITLTAIRNNIEDFFENQHRLPADFTDIIKQSQKARTDNYDLYDCVVNPDNTVSISCLRWNGETTRTMTMTFHPQKDLAQ